ncbi:phage tail protein [Moraxella haemolytica]|uniref:TipJ family phage tail tip protein n=1 Tax=Moraxella haemolytica TaxID=2904119 RepID=UPI0025434946|nr:phage tail protein [Moraxella sp. ZY171148]WII96005.1 phage tail protein [Moraxella sp. ZY171148]
MNIHGSKKQKGQARKPTIATDDLVSTGYAQILYGLCEGEIAGLADDGKSILLENTPLINDNGQPNFDGVSWEFRTGTLDQTHIAGFPAVENEHNIGVELRHDRDWTRQINNRELSAVRVRLNFNALREQKENGDITGYAISYAIDVQTDGGSFVEVLTDTVRGKASQGYKKAHRIDLPNSGTAKRWTIRVRRITPNRDSELVADTMSIDALTEIIDAKLSYPCTALLGISYDAKTFNNIAKIAVRLKGKIIQVPSNYNPETRTYNGLWDGTFKPAYSNNPAWVYYDLCTHHRYGLGERLSGMVDKWRLYQIGQYCDELVDDGKGGKEPRFTCNVYIQKADDAYRVLQNLASVFRGLSFWDGQNIVVDSDTPKEPVYTFSPANVVGGEFSYTGTRARDRHTLAKVAWDNPENNFTTEYELIPDEGAIAKYGVRTLDISAFGCTSQGQAQRAGLWALKAEQLETQTVSFKTGLMGFIPQVGQVINIADNVFAGRAISGKIVAVADNQKIITLDRAAGKVGDIITLNTLGQIATATITAVHGETLTLDKAMGEIGDVWAIISDDLKLMQFRVLTIAQNDDATFDITALEYNRQKYQAVDNGAIVTQEPFTVLKVATISAPKSVSLTASTRTVQGQAITTLSINWEQVAGAVAYIVEWRKDDNAWQSQKIASQSLDIDGVYAGNYQARVRAVDAFDNESLATTSQLTNITGKTGKPPKLYLFKVKGGLFSMYLDWIFNHGSEDTNYTEIQISPDGQANIATLAVFSYPTNSHTITGLQGNLTQFYRARIVDKLGNTSDWTDWISGTTSSDAAKVLDLISGQISESHLDRTLREPIAKIDAFDGKINLFNAKIPSIEQAVQQANARLPQLNRSIDELMRDKNAKSQEIANIRQNLGNTTTQIRDVATSTSNLTRRLGEMMVNQQHNNDTLNARIQTVQDSIVGTEQAINQMRETMNAKFTSLSDNLLVGGDETKVSTDWGIRYPIKEQLSARQRVKISLKNAQNLTSVAVYNSGTSGSAKIGDLRKVGDEWVGEFAWRIYGSNNELILYRQPRRSRQSVQAVLAKHTDTTALIDEVKRTLAEKERALSERIGQLDTTLNGQTTSIRNVQRSVNGVRAIKAVTVDNNGFISGYGLMSDLQNGRVTSRFGINADQIYFGATTSAKKPFVFTTRTTTIDGVSYPAGAWLNSASIARASINMLHIADSIQSDNYVAGRQGWRLFKDGRFELNNTFGDGSSLELNSKGLIVWYNKARGKKAVELGIFR